MKPANEAYAEFLLAQNDPKHALEVFEKSLNRHPRRLLSLQGKQKAAKMIDNQKALAEAKKELEVSLKGNERGEIL